MQYSEFQDLRLSRLGFGTMRLPLLPGGGEGDIDEARVAEMVRYAVEHGVNYFDTAYPYHASQAERVVGRVLKAYPRDSFYLATKFPGHQLAERYDPKAIFDEQLEKCGVEYFDFYLLHNVYEKSIYTYLDPRWGIIDYFLEQKRLGRIRHLGFSTHGSHETIERFLKLYGEQMEFCQIQLNYLDWTLQDAKGTYELLERYHIPVWVMEPVRGGKLAHLNPAAEAELKARRPEESAAAWALRWVQALPNVKMVLSGMSDLAQMKDNVATFSGGEPLNEEEMALLARIADAMHSDVPCTGCRYCCDGCPMGLDIPALLQRYNEARFSASMNLGISIEALPEDKRPSACVGCGQCAQVCPQGIDIPAAMKDFAEICAALPSWEEICRQRDEAARKSGGKDSSSSAGD